MITPKDLPFRQIWTLDFEFNQSGREGNPQNVVCMAARELYSGEQILLWEDDLRALGAAPFDVGPDNLFVAYLASAEWGCFLDLGWKIPDRIFDVYCEARVELNGLPNCYPSLLKLAQRYKLSSILEEEKDEMRYLILGCGPWSNKEKKSIMDYCLGDVLLLEEIFPLFIRDISPDRVRLCQALMRGRYTAAVAHIERCGIPLDAPLLERFMENWGSGSAQRLAVIKCWRWLCGRS